ncbi:GGDEF domain-containing protein, partial [Herbaspirillum sp. 3C11]|uniref:GGDEF domain-containing protein n=2 Tax=Herbaspirillum TaxID=963 RepID=UPI0010744BD4
GHAEGDRALQDFSAILSRSFRQSDIVGRLGGDEFAALLPNTGKQQAEVALRFLEKAVKQHNRSAKRPYKLCYSVGHVDSDAATSIAELMQRADARMYEDKKQHGHHRSGSGAFAALLDMLLPLQRKYRH